jgi:hypothetical protein
MSITGRVYNELVMVVRTHSQAEKSAAAGGRPAAAGLRLQGVAGREDVTLFVVGDEAAAAACSRNVSVFLLCRLNTARAVLDDQEMGAAVSGRC